MEKSSNNKYDYIDFLKQVPLFETIDKSDMHVVIDCLKCHITDFSKDEYIFMEGDEIKYVGLLLDGHLQIENLDYLGNKNIIANIVKKELFGEVFASVDLGAAPVSVKALVDSKVMFINFKSVLNNCLPKNCAFVTTLLYNMFKITAEKNKILNQKIRIITKRNLEEKIITYLSFVSKESNSKIFDIPFSRQELADYLCVDRTSLSRKLAQLKDEGMIDFHKNSFTLL